MPIALTSRFFLSALVFCTLSGCLPGRGGLFRGQTPSNVKTASFDDGEAVTIYIIGHGWHTGLVLPTEEIDAEDFPNRTLHSGGRFVEIGWGDEGFYNAKVVWPTIVAKALFLPTPSVLHLVRFDPAVDRVFVGSDIVELKISREGFRRLCRFIHNSFELDDAGKPIWSGPGIYGDGQFYRGKESYYYPKTCNVWTARALQAAGVPVLPALSTTATGVLAQARPHGRVLSKSSPMALVHALTGTAPARD